MRKLTSVISVLILLTAACQREAPANPASPTLDATAKTTHPTATATRPPTAPPPTPTLTPVVAPPSATPLPTSTAVPATPTSAGAVEPAAPSPSASATALPPTPTGTAGAAATAPPAATGGGVSQPPYQASPCSDRYPCNDDKAGWEARIRVPAGYTVAYFAHLANRNPTGLAFGPDGLLYAATQQGTIYRIDRQGRSSAYVSGLIAPTGIAFRPGTSQLFVTSRVVEANVDGEGQLAVIENGGIRQLIGGLPCCYAFMHGPHDIVFDAAGNGYLGVGARADHGEVLGGDGQQDTLHPFEARILKFNPNTGSAESFATGLRNPYGLAIDANGVLYATDNAPDYGPPDEFHRIFPGENHGYPWYDCEVCFSPPEGTEPLPPTYRFPPHVSPTGTEAYLGSQFPGAYNSIFVALWSAFPGAQKIVRFGPGGSGASDFATGFAAPIDVTTDPEGHLYIADWATGIIFKVTYTG